MRANFSVGLLPLPQNGTKWLLQLLPSCAVKVGKKKKKDKKDRGNISLPRIVSDGLWLQERLGMESFCFSAYIIDIGHKEGDLMWVENANLWRLPQKLRRGLNQPNKQTKNKTKPKLVIKFGPPPFPEKSAGRTSEKEPILSHIAFLLNAGWEPCQCLLILPLSVTAVNSLPAFYRTHTVLESQRRPPRKTNLVYCLRTSVTLWWGYNISLFNKLSQKMLEFNACLWIAHFSAWMGQTGHFFFSLIQ